LLANGHYNVGFFARGGCPAPYLTPWHNDRHKLERYKLRESHYKTRIDYLLSVLKPGDRIVFVSSLPSYLGEGVTPSRAKVAAGYRSAIRKVDREVKARGGRLVLVSPLPSFPDSQIKTPLSMCKIEWFRPAWTVPLDCKILTVSRDNELLKSQPIRSLQQALARESNSIDVFDPFPAICQAGQPSCANQRQGVFMFSDSNHLTNAGAAMLSKSFTTFLHQSDSRLENPRSAVDLAVPKP
jgi:hypothetical protein